MYFRCIPGSLMRIPFTGSLSNSGFSSKSFPSCVTALLGWPHPTSGLFTPLSPPYLRGPLCDLRHVALWLFLACALLRLTLGALPVLAHQLGTLFPILFALSYYPSHLPSSVDALRHSCSLTQALKQVESAADFRAALYKCSITITITNTDFGLDRHI